ncbi:MAG: transposase [Candidatus Omnitrophica bacterium]|nr:transposase [Candidatus Omnitrophota bacterium]
MQLSNPRELGAFIGLVPREHSTGDKISKGSITHMGDVFLRSLLIEASWVIIRKDTRMRQFYDRIRSRHHPHIAARKAIVAVARKLTLIIYRVLKEQRDYIA